MLKEFAFQQNRHGVEVPSRLCGEPGKPALTSHGSLVVAITQCKHFKFQLASRSRNIRVEMKFLVECLQGRQQTSKVGGSEIRFFDAQQMVSRGKIEVFGLIIETHFVGRDIDFGLRQLDKKVGYFCQLLVGFQV